MSPLNIQSFFLLLSLLRVFFNRYCLLCCWCLYEKSVVMDADVGFIICAVALCCCCVVVVVVVVCVFLL